MSRRIPVDRPTYIYALTSPGDKAIRYVGATVRPTVRYRTHLESASSPNTDTSRWIANLAEDGLRPDMKVLEIWHDRLGAREAEVQTIWMCLARGEPILNHHRHDHCPLHNYISGRHGAGSSWAYP